MRVRALFIAGVIGSGSLIPLVGCAPGLATICRAVVLNTNIHNSEDNVGLVHVFTNQNICVAPDGTVTGNSGGSNVATYGSYSPVANAHPLGDTGWTGATQNFKGWETWIPVDVTVQVNVDLVFLGIHLATSGGRCSIRYRVIIRSGGSRVNSDVVPTRNTTGKCGGGFKVSNAT